MIRLERGSSDHRTCRHCGAHVSDRVAAVHGDDEDIAHRCPGCDCFRRLSQGSAAGIDVNVPDPAENPNRNRGQRVGSAVRVDGGEVDGD